MRPRRAKTSVSKESGPKWKPFSQVTLSATCDPTRRTTIQTPIDDLVLLVLRSAIVVLLVEAVFIYAKWWWITRKEPTVLHTSPLGIAFVCFAFALLIASRGFFGMQFPPLHENWIDFWFLVFSDLLVIAGLVWLILPAWRFNAPVRWARRSVVRLAIIGTISFVTWKEFAAVALKCWAVPWHF